MYAALVDPVAVQHWMVPDGMTSEVEEFDAREGGAFRISLTYEAADRSGKTEGATDTHQGRFVRLVPDEEVVQVTSFETDDVDLQGEMRITFRLRDVDGGTEVEGIHEGLPDAVDPADNEAGWSMALAKLAALVESA